jgi:uncharacterized protein (TIGR00369 family)
MTRVEFIERLNAELPASMQSLCGRLVDLDRERQNATLEFAANRSMCNPGDGVQGGFVCGMLDAAMAYAVFSMLGEFAIVATLEIKVSYLEITRPGKLRATGSVLRAGKTVTFLEAELHDADGRLLATANSTARVIRNKIA